MSDCTTADLLLASITAFTFSSVSIYILDVASLPGSVELNTTAENLSVLVLFIVMFDILMCDVPSAVIVEFSNTASLPTIAILSLANVKSLLLNVPIKYILLLFTILPSITVPSSLKNCEYVSSVISCY